MCSVQVINNNITIGELIAFTAYLPRLFGLFNVLSSSNVYIQKQLGVQDKIFNFYLWMMSTQTLQIVILMRKF